MRVAICSVGSELVSGEVADTNAAWLAQRVHECGCRVVAHLVTGDDRAGIVDMLAFLAKRADAIVIGGGLGPTSDDVTRHAVAYFAGLDLERRPELVEALERSYLRLGRPITPSVLTQADIPVAGRVYPALGTAAGFALDVARSDRRTTVHVLPGVPWEYRGMAEHDVLPDLVTRSGGRARVVRTLHIAGMGESSVGAALEHIGDRLAAANARPDDPEYDIELSFLADPEDVRVRVSAVGPDPVNARRRAEPVVDEVAGILGDAVTSIDDRRIEDEVVRLLAVKGLSVSTAEALTGGRVATLLGTPVAGAAHLRGGLVVGTSSAWADLLGPATGAIDQSGVASRALVEAMAEAARRRFGSDLAVATAGVAGPMSASGEPAVGTALWSVSMAGGPCRTEEVSIRGDRHLIQSRAAAMAVAALRRALLVA